MRLLVCADVHLDAPFIWLPGPPALAEQPSPGHPRVRWVDLCADAALQVDALLCAGDLYEHDRVTPDTAQFLRSSFGDLGVPVFLAPGNHDWLGPTSLYSEVRWPDNVVVFADDRLRPVPLTDGVTLWGAAHRAPANTDDFLAGFDVDRGGVHLALFHGSERAALGQQGAGKVPHAPFRAEEVPAAGLHHAFVGHFHAPVEAPWHTYPGNPEPLSFGELGPRGAVLAEVAPDGSVARERYPVGRSRVHAVLVDITGARHSGDVREMVGTAVADLEGIVRVTLVGAVAPEVEIRLTDLRDVGAHLDALVPRLGDLSVAYDLEAVAGEPTVRGQFVRDVLQDPSLDEGTRQRVLVTGLRALDGRAGDLAAH